MRRRGRRGASSSGSKRVKPPSDQLMQSYASLRPRAMTRGLAASGDANDAGVVPDVHHDAPGHACCNYKVVLASDRKTLANAGRRAPLPA